MLLPLMRDIVVLEYGTRYMAPETFMFPVYERYTRKVREDLERLVNG